MKEKFNDNERKKILIISFSLMISLSPGLGTGLEVYLHHNTKKSLGNDPFIFRSKFSQYGRITVSDLIFEDGQDSKKDE